MPKARVNGVALYYEVTGEGPVLVLLNGIFQRTELWEPLLAHLEGYTVIRYDMRGQGRSEAPEGPYPPEAHAADLDALLAHLGVSRYHLLGLSNGGVVAQHHAAQNPPGLERLVLACTLAHLDAAARAKVESWRAALLAGGTRLRMRVALPWIYGRGFLAQNPGLIEEAALEEAARFSPTPAAQRRLLEGFLTLGDLRPKLRRVRAPALVIAGAEDLLFPPAYAEELAAALPQARLVVLRGVGHVAPLEDPEGFARTVRAFLEGDDA
ncbi:alpha/beta fold hydrolase [Marinithermus hydrothermalis]|uniref:Alpha/beta hydrolase fold protein n=1 Tax=Marinithermus hydrothermalis (strain DSM 14884 / JCM 11576 / T1) TaxID=869210 RepID=F2NPU3_MARHT|nr:alpha/beta hydrolase [Marinithermus hydrothermalis]AEB12869.1 alpha/beta hydrolase fold protein [Marinithermus hydrothermalis DSM 14884]